MMVQFSNIIMDLCEGKPPVTGGFPHKGPVARKKFPFDDAIIDGARKFAS